MNITIFTPTNDEKFDSEDINHATAKFKEKGYHLNVINSTKEYYKLEEAHVVIAGSTPFRIPEMDLSPNLKFIVRAGFGIDSIDTTEATRRNIMVKASRSNENSITETIQKTFATSIWMAGEYLQAVPLNS